MLHSGGKGGESYFTRHLNDAPPNAVWPHDADSDRDKIRVAYQHQIHKYIRCATGNDDNLRRVLDYLDAENLTDDTIVIYTSDQGYWLGQHGFYDKRLILETSMRMPFLIRYPRMIQPGSVNKELCVNVDIAPTLLEMAGVEIPKDMQGRSMVPLLKGQALSGWRQSQFYTYWGTPNHYGIRTDRFTYVNVAGHPVELFDRESDPGQVHNVAGSSEYQEVIAQLELELQKQIETVEIQPEELPGSRANRNFHASGF
jgi:arylsulfatase A-like enzyme